MSEVRRLKLEGQNDQDISNVLSSQYSHDDIAQALTALQYMKPAGAVSDEVLSETPRRSLSPKKFWLRFFLIVIGLLLAWFGVLFLITLLEQRRIDAVLKEQYGVEKSYTAGFLVDCGYQGATSFGDLAGMRWCDLVMAKVYYPKILTSTDAQPENSSYNPGGTIHMVEYVGADGQSLWDYTQFGMPIKQPGDANDEPYPYKKNLEMRPFDRLVFSGVRSNYSQQSDVGDKYRWSSDEYGLGRNTSGSRLQDSIDKKVLSDTPPASGAPSTSQVLAEDRAPLVVYYSLRICQSPRLPLVDQLCLLR